MKVKRDAAIKLFRELGLKNADKWNDNRLCAKLSKIGQMVDEDVVIEDQELAELLKGVLSAAEDGASFELEATEAPVKEPKEEKADKPAEPAKDDGKKDKGKSKTPKTKKTSTKGRPYLAGQAIKKFGLDGKMEDMIKLVNDVAGVPGSKTTTSLTFLRATQGIAGFLGKESKETRPYCAGVVLKKHGSSEITEGMVKEVNEAFGVVNDKESKSMLCTVAVTVEGYNAA